MSIFSDYANYYNLLYKDKNYEAESKYIVNLISQFQRLKSQTLLDVGCGTGQHAFCFAKHGYHVVGIDNSVDMISIAKGSNTSIDFLNVNAVSFNLERKFDVVSSLFHVASYQTSEAEINGYFSSISKHLNKNGLFIFDFWYGPAVLTDKPVVRIKKLESDSLLVTRISEPKLYVNDNKVNINFHIFIKDKLKGTISEIEEHHSMRYFFLSEIIGLLGSNGLSLVASEEWMTGNKLDDKTWYACIVGRKI